MYRSVNPSFERSPLDSKVDSSGPTTYHDTITFKYCLVSLRKHSWKDYTQSNNPVAAALMSKMNFAEEEKVRVKLEFTRMVLNMKLDSARMSLGIRAPDNPIRTKGGNQSDGANYQLA
jgi:hypothetical protein